MAIESGYLVILDRIRQRLDEGKVRAQIAVEYERVLTYWEVGGYVIDYLDRIGIERGEQVVKKLALDVDIRERLLYEMVEMRRAFPFLPSGAKTSWSHFRRLISVRDEQVRYRYLEAAASERWSVAQLTERIQDGLFGAEDGEGTGGVDPGMVSMVRAKRGELYVYRVAERGEEKVLDLGFRSMYRLDGADRFEAGDLVRSVKVEPKGLDGLTFRLVKADDLRRRLYAYKAKVLRIIDGDTLWATIDFGFEMLTDHKLRLRGIDAPELKSAKGQVAKAWLEKRLSGRTFVVTTTKVDLFDRDLADIFASGRVGEGDRADEEAEVVAREGVFVNREMVEEGMARIWQEW